MTFDLCLYIVQDTRTRKDTDTYTRIQTLRVNRKESLDHRVPSFNRSFSLGSFRHLRIFEFVRALRGRVQALIGDRKSSFRLPNMCTEHQKRGVRSRMRTSSYLVASRFCLKCDSDVGRAEKLISERYCYFLRAELALDRRNGGRRGRIKNERGKKNAGDNNAA